MSNHYAVAMVTAALQQRLNKAVGIDVLGASASMVRPDEPGAADPGVNVFLYQVSPDAARRNEDLPTRTGGGDLVRRPRAAIDLHYLLTVNGSADKFEPQLVLGSVVRELHAKPMLTRLQIEDAKSAFPLLEPSNLAEEPELVKFTQLPLTLEELSKLWSVFFQAKYQLSVAYQGAVVLIEPDDSFGTPLPVRIRNVYVDTLREPVIETIVAASGDGNPILAGTDVRIRGHGLIDIDLVRIDGTAAPVQRIADTEAIATLPPLAAGVHGLAVERSRKMGTPEVDHQPGVRSSVHAFVLTPSVSGITPVAGGLRMDVDPVVGDGQRALLMLNELTATNPGEHRFTTKGDGTNPLIVQFAGVGAGTYLVRLQVDGASSPLEVAGDAYAQPQVML